MPVQLRSVASRLSLSLASLASACFCSCTRLSSSRASRSCCCCLRSFSRISAFVSFGGDGGAAAWCRGGGDGTSADWSVDAPAPAPLSSSSSSSVFFRSTKVCARKYGGELHIIIMRAHVI